MPSLLLALPTCISLLMSGGRTLVTTMSTCHVHFDYWNHGSRTCTLFLLLCLLYGQDYVHASYCSSSTVIGFGTSRFLSFDNRAYQQVCSTNPHVLRAWIYDYHAVLPWYICCYLLPLTYFNRAWYIIGHSIRHAQAFDLHRKAVDTAISDQRRQALKNIWCSLHSVESTLTMITGRSRILTEQECTVIIQSSKTTATLHNYSWQTQTETLYQPTLLDTASIPSFGNQAIVDSSQDARIMLTNFLESRLTLDVIMSRVVSKLYQTRPQPSSWYLISNETSNVNLEMEQWVSAYLPQMSRMDAPAGKSPIDRERIILYLTYKIVKILVTWPCLRMFHQGPNMLDQMSDMYLQQYAYECVQAAMDITNLLPGEPDLHWFCNYGPWWLRVHLSKADQVLAIVNV